MLRQEYLYSFHYDHNENLIYLVLITIILILLIELKFAIIQFFLKFLSQFMYSSKYCLLLLVLFRMLSETLCDRLIFLLISML